jgi:hypothetical protein
VNYADRPLPSYADDIFIVKIFWKRVNIHQDQYMQLTLSRMAYTQLLNEIDRGISGACYRVIDGDKNVHRINKYELRNLVAWERR